MIETTPLINKDLTNYYLGQCEENLDLYKKDIIIHGEETADILLEIRNKNVKISIDWNKAKKEDLSPKEVQVLKSLEHFKKEIKMGHESIFGEVKKRLIANKAKVIKEYERDINDNLISDREADERAEKIVSRFFSDIDINNSQDMVSGLIENWTDKIGV